jgi:hypothetical protein
MMHALKRLARKARDFLIDPILQRNISTSHPDGVDQLQLHLAYRALRQSGAPLPDLPHTGFRVFSQADEDGILLYIFSLIGTVNQKSVEICAGDGIECNTANLIINHGWHGLLVDGQEALVRKGREFYNRNPHTCIYPPKFVNSWITRGSINQLLVSNGFEGELDLLVIDMDGVDYWIWDAISCISPRVVVVEYQDIIGPDRALTVPYHDRFNAYTYPTTLGLPNFCGASLPAFVKLAKTKGYRLAAVTVMASTHSSSGIRLEQRRSPKQTSPIALDIRKLYGE